MPTARETLAQILATSREAGTPDALRARTLIAQHLRAAGYQVEEQRFGFPVTALLAFPLLGAGLGWLVLLEFPLLVLPRLPSWLAPVAWVSGLTALGSLVYSIGAGWAPAGAEHREEANLIATRGAGPVRRWIVAHSDTKAQGHSMAGRLVALWAVVVAIVLVSAFTILRIRAALPLPVVVVGTAISMVAGALAGRGRLRGSSQGARDNGSGLLAALIAAETTQDVGTGILITGAEEFGLVGSRVFARSRDLGGVEVVNFDTLDDTGRVYLVFHDSQGRDVARRDLVALGSLGLELRVRRLPIGILVDSLPLARSGASAVTLSRLGWSTLRVMHTPRDTPTGMSFETAERVGRIVGR